MFALFVNSQVIIDVNTENNFSLLINIYKKCMQGYTGRLGKLHSLLYQK